MDTIYKLSAKITPVNLKKDCTTDYDGASYAMYTRDRYGLLHLTKNIAKGCGISDNLNKLIDDFIREFEKPGDKDLLYVLNKTLAEKVNKPISDVTDKNFETHTEPYDTFNTRGFRPILILMVYCASGQRSPSQVEIKFRSPTVQKSVGKGYVTKRKPTFSRTYQLRKKQAAICMIYISAWKNINK